MTCKADLSVQLKPAASAAQTAYHVQATLRETFHL